MSVGQSVSESVETFSFIIRLAILNLEAKSIFTFNYFSVPSRPTTLPQT